MAKRVAAKSAAQVNGQTALERACQRAAASGWPIVGRGWRVTDGALALAVPSQSEPGKRHMVVLVGAHLECDCKGYVDYALTCIHCGVVANEMAAEAQAFAARQAEARRTETAKRAASKPTPIVPTRSDADRASAPLARSNAPFSLFKAS